MADAPQIYEPDFNNPVAVLLRRQMKGDYIHSISNIPASDWKGTEGSKLILFGSTLMHQLHFIDKMQFPFTGTRVSDIDIGIWLPNNKYGDSDRGMWTDFRSHFYATVPQLLKKATVDAGFNAEVTVAPGSHEYRDLVFDRGDIQRLDPTDTRQYFSRPFHIYRTFSPEDVRYRIRKSCEEGHFGENERDILLKEADRVLRDDKTQQEQLLKVSLTISPETTPLAMTLPPESLYPGSEAEGHGRIPLLRANRLDLIAGKLTRIMAHPEKSKSGDLLDIYNLTHSPVLDNPSPEDLKTLRLMVVTYLAGNGVREPYADSTPLFKQIDDSPENRRRLQENLRGQMATHRFPELEDKTDEVLESVRGLIKKIFPEKPGQTYGPLHYTEAEVRFTAAIFGDNPDTALKKPPAGRSWLLGRWGSSAVPHVKDTPLPNCRIDAEILRNDYGRLIDQYSTAINNNPWLIATVDDARERHLRLRGAQYE